VKTLREMTNLRGDSAIVTGGSGWIGSAITAALVELGAHVIVVSRGDSDDFIDSKLDKSITHIIADITNADAVHALFKDPRVTLCRPSILVNNMCSWPSEVHLHSQTPAVISSQLTENVVPHALMMQQFVDMLTSHDDEGSIINVASMYAHVAPDHDMYRDQGGQSLMYGAAKAALVQMTRHLAGLWGRTGIRVNSISPGPFSRPGSFVDKPWFEQELKNRTMLHRVGAPEEIKGVIALLATDAGSYITGVDIPIDGGWTAR
jgi:NAD(P)-dependent dehydrogenase (short-subunit alcohol dehydrogenase family)